MTNRGVQNSSSSDGGKAIAGTGTEYTNRGSGGIISSSRTETRRAAGLCPPRLSRLERDRLSTSKRVVPSLRVVIHSRRTITAPRQIVLVLALLKLVGRFSRSANQFFPSSLSLVLDLVCKRIGRDTGSWRRRWTGGRGITCPSRSRRRLGRGEFLFRDRDSVRVVVRREGLLLLTTLGVHRRRQVAVEGAERVGVLRRGGLSDLGAEGFGLVSVYRGGEQQVQRSMECETT